MATVRKLGTIEPEMCNNCTNFCNFYAPNCVDFVPRYFVDDSVSIGISCYNYIPLNDSIEPKSQNQFDFETNEHYVNIKRGICEFENILDRLDDNLSYINQELLNLEEKFSK